MVIQYAIRYTQYAIRDIAENRTSSPVPFRRQPKQNWFGARQKPLIVKIGKVLNLGNLDFDIVSVFVLRISYFASLGISTTVEESLQIRLFMQNKANFRKSQMNVNKEMTKDYEKRTLGGAGKQSQFKANQSQFKPN